MKHLISKHSRTNNRSDEDILISILSSFISKKQSIQIPKTTLIWSFPLIDKQKLQDIEMKLHKGAQYPDALSEIRPSLSFNIDILLSILNCYQDENLIQKIKSNHFFSIPLYYAIYWLSSANLNSDIISQGTPCDLTQHYQLLIQVILLLFHRIDSDYYYFCLQKISSHFFRYGHSTFSISIIPTLFERPEPQMLDVAATILAFLYTDQYLTTAHALIDRLTVEISRNPTKFANYPFDSLINATLQFLSKYDIHTLGLFSALATVSVDSSLLEAFFDLPRIYLGQLDKNGIKVRSISLSDLADSLSNEAGSITELRPSLNTNSSVDYSSDDDLNPPPISAFQTKMEFSDLLHQQEMENLKVLLSLLSKVLIEYANSFFSGFVELIQTRKNQRYSLELFISFLFSLSNFQRIEINDSIFDIITNDVTFMPQLTIFNQKETEESEQIQQEKLDFELVAFIRKSVLFILAKRGPKYLPTLLQKIKDQPFLFADVIGRIHVNLEKFDLDLLTDESSIDSIVHVISMMSSYDKSINSAIEKVSQARSTILLFLFSILENASVASCCFASNVFTRGFLARIFDPSFRKPVIIVLRQFLTKIKADSQVIFVPAVDFICSIINVCSSMEEYEDHEAVACGLLETVNDSIIHNRFLPLKFESLITASTRYLAVRPSTKFLDQTVQLYSQMLFASDHYSVSNVQIQQLSIAIRKSDGLRPSEATVCGLIGMMARSRSVNVNSSFFVQEPKISILLFSIIQTPEDTIKYISLFLQLCQHSAYNCTQCHKGEVDLLLVRMLKKYPNSFTFRGCQFNLIISKENVIKYVFPLLNLISYFESSPQYCAGLVSLMAPTFSKTGQNIMQFPQFALDTIKQLSTTVIKLVQDIQVSLPLGLNERTFTVEGVKVVDVLTYGFTFQFYLFADVHSLIINNKKPIIITIISSGQIILELYLQGQSVVCRCDSKDRSSSLAALYTNFPSCQWALVTLKLQQFNNNTSAISFALNNGQPNTFNLVLPQLDDGPLDVQLGGLDETPSSIETETPEIDAIVYLGPFRYYNDALEKKELAELSELGSRRCNDQQLPLFCYPPLDQGQQLKITKKAPDFPLYENIVENWRKLQVLRITVPLFLYFEIMPPHFSELLLDTLLCVVENEKQFPFFSLIGQILTNKPLINLNYSLYLKFFAFAENLTDQDLIESLITHVLMNMELWFIAESSQFIRILIHWSQNLYPSCHNIIDHCFSFTTLFTNAQIYLWYKPIESVYIKGGPRSERKRDPNLDIDTCRMHYNKLLLLYVSNNPDNFQTEDAQRIISHCASCQDPQQVYSILQLFMNILKKNIYEYRLPESSKKLIYLQFKPENEERFIVTYKILYHLTERKHLNFYTDVVISLMNDLYFTNSLFDKCVSLMINEKYTSIYPLCIFLSMNLGIDQIYQMAKLLSEIEFDKETANIVTFDKNWCSWPLALLSEITTFNHNSIVDLIEKIEPDDINANPALGIIQFLLNVVLADFSLDLVDNLMNTFDLFSLLYSYSFELYSKLFFTIIALNFLNTENRDIQYGILFRCMRSLILRVNDPPNMVLYTLYKESAYYSDRSTGTNILEPIQHRPNILFLNDNEFSLNESSSDSSSAFNSSNISKIASNNYKSLRAIIKNLNAAIKASPIYSVMNKNIIHNFYQFGFLLDFDGKPLFSNLYNITKLYLDKVPPVQPIIVFWKRTYESMINQTLKQTDKGEGFNRKFVDFSILFMHVNNKNNLKIFNSILEGLDKSQREAQSTIDVLDSEQIAIAAIDIHNATQNYPSIRQLKKLLKMSMQEDSPWHDKRYQLSEFVKAFVSDSSYGQPYLKRSFSEDDSKHLSQFTSSPLTIAKSNTEFYKLLLNSNNGILPKRYIFDEKTLKKMFKCKQIKFTKEVDALFNITSDSFQIIKVTSFKEILFSDIKRIFIRWRFHRPNSLEFYLKSGETILLDFTPFEANKILSNFNSINPQLVQTVSREEFFAATDYTHQWEKGEMSNFDYLMILNVFSGRSFNEPTSYPIFPWVLSDYTNPKKFSYRDLSRPIAAQNKEQDLIYLIAPSSPTLLDYFLFRLRPFNTIPREMKIDRFRLTKEPFTSLQKAYDAATLVDVLTCNELTPEFYSAPHFFTNDRLFMNDNEKNPAFQLPAWASSAEEFVYIHRKALESRIVSSALNSWIDLMFGCNSRNNPAQRCNNVFNPVMFSESASSDDEKSLESNLRKIGHMPAQLFKKEHPRKKIFSRSQTFQHLMSASLDIPGLYDKEREEKDVPYGILSATIIETSLMVILTLVFMSDGTVHCIRTDFMSQMNRVTTKIGKIAIDSRLDYDFASSNISPSLLKQDVPRSPSLPLNPSNSLPAVMIKNGSPGVQKLTRTKRPSRFGHDSIQSIGSQPLPLVSNKSMIPTKVMSDESDVLTESSDHLPRDHSFAMSHSNSGLNLNSTSTLNLMESELTSHPQSVMRIPTLVSRYSNDLVVCSLQSAFVVIDNKKRELHYANARSIKVFRDIEIRDVTSLASSGHIIAATGINGEVFGWDERNFSKKLDFCSIGADYVTTIAISTKFGIIACGLAGGQFCVYSMHTHLLQFMVKMPAEPSRIIITSGWGFIILESNQELFLFTVTGKLIRRTPLDFVIETWHTFSCERGFDYIIIADIHGQIRMSEAFYLEFNEISYQSKARVLDMKYIVPIRGIAIISADGYATLVPKGLT